jgi:hypothetical protein
MSTHALGTLVQPFQNLVERGFVWLLGIVRGLARSGFGRRRRFGHNLKIIDDYWHRKYSLISALD